MRPAIDAHKDQHVRVILAAFAEETDSATVIVGHLNKAPSREPYLRIGGSTAFYNAVRSVLLVTEDEEADMRLIAQDKANYTRKRPVERPPPHRRGHPARSTRPGHG